MNLTGAEELARRGELYPGVILHGSSAEVRLEAGVRLGRTLLCERAAESRPCGECRHCRRIALPGGDGEVFHPDFQVLARDLKTSTSVEATKTMLRTAQVRPFEARGQVFLVTSAESLTGAAANALLKNLEEPARSAPRHFLLLAPSSVDLLPTLRSRSLSIYLGSATQLGEEGVAELAAEIARHVELYLESGSAVYLLAMARSLERAGQWQDVRASHPWVLAASSIVRALRDADIPSAAHRPLLALAEDLLGAATLRLRGIPPLRLLEGLITRQLAPLGGSRLQS